MKSVFYERLFQLTRCLEQVGEILDLYELDRVIHPVYANSRKAALEELRADLCYTLSGMINQRELKTCVAVIRTQTKRERKAESQPQLPKAE